MNVLVTGGTGYIGGRLCEYLLENSYHSVNCATRNSSIDTSSKIKNIFIDFESEEKLRDCCNGIDVIVHLAAKNANECLADPVEAINFNTIGTLRLLEAAKKEKVSRIIYLSTAHVYGNPLVGSISESTHARPLSAYATTHRAAEDLILASDYLGKIEGIVLRLSNAFGAPNDLKANCWTLIFNDLCRQAVLNKTLVLRSAGLQRRDFIPLNDVCRAISHLIELPFKNLNSRLFNVGGNWTPTILEVANVIADHIYARSGNRISIHSAKENITEESVNFSYNLDLLYETGFRLNTNRLDELESLISFCEREFGE